MNQPSVRHGRLDIIADVQNTPPFLRGEQRGSLNRRCRCCKHFSEKDRKRGREAFNRRVIEATPVVLEGSSPAVAIPFEEEREVELRRCRVDGDRLEIHPIARKRRHSGRRRHEECGHDRRSYGGLPFDGRRDDLIKREHAMADSGEECLPHPPDVIDERRSCRRVVIPTDAHGKRIEKATDRDLLRSASTQRHRRADDDVVGAGHATEPSVERSKKDLELRRADLAGKGSERSSQIPVDGKPVESTESLVQRV